MIKFVDIIQDLSYGDCGKGAVAYSLSKKPEYNLCMRVNGGCNAGHTIYHNGKKFVTHQVPTGIFHGKTCIIGSGCVVTLSKLKKEIEELEAEGVQVRGKLFIAGNAHIVMSKHVQEEIDEAKIGTTKQGIGPCYRDKYARSGIRIENLLTPFKTIDTPEDTVCIVTDIDGGKDHSFFTDMIIDLYSFLYDRQENFGILVEGAQGFYLDIDHGDYPYVSSSHSSVAGALLNCLPYNKVRKVYGVIKAYETYVGAKKFQPDDPIFDKLADLGQEFGATTGRRRQCDFLNLQGVKEASNINAVTHLVVSKLDVLKELNAQEEEKHWKIRDSSGWTLDFADVDDFTMFIKAQMFSCCDIPAACIQFKYGPEEEIIV